MSAILGQLGRLGHLGGAASGGLTKAALIARLTTLGALACYLPSTYATTAWQRYDATTARAAVGYGVGFLGDIMQGMALGQELLVNNDFTTGSTGWVTAEQVTFSAGRCQLTNDGAAISQAGRTEINRHYWFADNVVNTTFNGTYFLYRPIYKVLINAPGVRTRIVRATTTNFSLNAGGGGGFVGTITLESISLKLNSGYSAEQPTESLRPSLRYTGGLYYIDPTSGQGLTAYLPASVGGTVTVVYANPGVGAVVATGVTVTGQELPLPYKHSCLVIMPSTASTEAVAAVAAMVDVLARRTVV